MNVYIAIIDQAISNTSCSSPLLVVGDLNCHLGHAGGPRSLAEPNHRGMQWKNILDSHSLYVPSLSQLATGPVHTFSSGSNSTTLDYIIGNFITSTVMVSCKVGEEHPLNTSDHLPITSKLNLSLLTTVSPSSENVVLDWTSAIKEGCISNYASLTDNVVAPLLSKGYSSIQEIEADISYVSKHLLDASLSTIPPQRHPSKYNPNRVYDRHLSTLCWHSRQAYHQWKAAGRPTSGPLFEARKRSKKNVQRHLSKCRAQIERKKIQKRDQSFRQNHPTRFLTKTQKKGGASLLVNGSLSSDPSVVLPHWVDHFSGLSRSRCSSNPNLQKFSDSVHKMELETYSDDELILDSPFDPEEVCAAIKRLKRSSSAGPDLLSPHHLLHAGPKISKWLSNIFNAIANLEAIPSLFKKGILIPIYKGKGKDPLIPTSYRGITLTSVLAKTLEILLQDRMLPILSDRNIPQLTQTAYQRGVSCADATFTCQETISKLIQDGDSVYSCFYDLASAFDTVEYPVLLSHLKNSGISGKTWRLIKDWYSDVHSYVRVGKATSSSFTVSRGVRQGSVLSPLLFLLVIDPLLLEFRRRSSGPSVCGLYLGAFSHADDIRTLSTNLSDCQCQINLVKDFASSQGLMLNVEKCEAVVSPSAPANMSHIEAGPLQIPLTNSARCLGAWWSPSLSCEKWVNNNIEKARRAFFARGSGVFHGKLNPLSSKNIIEHCVLPCLLYGAESWILNHSLLAKLESFQAELAKRILRLHRNTSNNIERMALHWPSMRARILIIKLKFLLKAITGDLSLSARSFRSLAVSDVESLLLVRQCRFLESTLDSNFTTSVLTSPNSVPFSSMKKDILLLDFTLLLDDAASHPSQFFVHKIASSQEVSWPKLWDLALERGVFGTTCIQAVLKLLSLHILSNNMCPVPNCNISLDSELPCSHFLSHHSELTASIEDIIDACVHCSDSLFIYGKFLHSSFKSIWHAYP